MIKTCISKDWKFKRGNNWKLSFATDYENIDLPHDYMISAERSVNASGANNVGYYEQNVGRYVKYLEFEEGKHYILDVDGAYMCAQIALNENHIALHPYGYTPFLVELTPYILKGIKNKLAISTTPTPCSSRWYCGNGVYRDVFLWQGGDVRIEPWDMFVSTDNISENQAKINLKYQLAADRDTNVKVVFQVIDKNGVKVAEKTVNIDVNKNEKTECSDILTIPSPFLWDNEHPNLYTLKTDIFEDEELLDEAENTFGIRTVTVNAKDGMMLNGNPIKLRGGCIHHDHGVLGAAAFPAAEERKVKLLKEAGFNAIRMAHNPPSLAMLDACDKLGMIVMDEAFDMWRKGKLSYDYHLFFDDWCTRDISYMVLRERNHPCVFSYSIGNEIFECDGLSDARKISKMLADEIRKFDNTRLVTSGVYKEFHSWGLEYESSDPDEYKNHFDNKFVYGTTQEWINSINDVLADYESSLDIVGFNYYYPYYENEHECYPDRAFWGSETQTIHFYDSWSKVMKHNYVLGDFTWTAIDNMGEVGSGRLVWQRDSYIEGLSLGGYPWRNCYQGDLDLCGYRRPQSFFREAIWIGDKEPRIFTTHPEHFGENYSGTGWHWPDVNESWTYDDKYIGRPIKVETYTDADKIVWYVNGKFIGESIPEKSIAIIETVYEKGEITAIAYKAGKEVSSYTVKTVGTATAINVSPEKTVFKADNRDLCYLDISVIDAEGNLVVSSEDELVCSVSGGELLGIFSSNPCNEDKFTSNRCHAFKGRALAIVRTTEPGDINVLVYSNNLASGSTKIKAE